MKELERNLKALANGRRLAILRILSRKKKASVSAIAEAIKLSFKSTSRHLGVLTGAGILEKEQIGLEVMHSLSERRHPIVSEVLKIL
ncbi:MAG TPA: metalloregulator ArsR/SmtB family transcription factor [Candidatus Paceibacterota bacterium]